MLKVAIIKALINQVVTKLHITRKRPVSVVLMNNASGDKIKVLIKRIYQTRISNVVFPNLSTGKSLSQAGISSVLKRMNKNKGWKDIHGQLITVHGFRGCFKTWTAEKTDTDWLTGEMALAHKIKDKSCATYQKGQLIDKRRRLMQNYSDYSCQNI
jgi:integrase